MRQRACLRRQAYYPPPPLVHVDLRSPQLADRLLEITGAIQKNADNKQVMDRLQVERERGITVKA